MNKKSHPDYSLWLEMRKRCNTNTSASYKYYGAIGIMVCKRWDDFWKFVYDMGDRPTRKHTIDRINSKGNYEPSNCRWATRAEQSANRRIKNECFNGHLWTEETTMYTNNGISNTRRCRICYNARLSGLALNKSRTRFKGIKK